MGKANKVKGEFLDAVEMVYLIQTLKDIADNKFYTLTALKNKFRRFGEIFVEFFRLISLTKAEHPLIGNKVPTVGIVLVTVEGSFLGEFNNKVFRLALEEKNKYEKYRFISIGTKLVERLRQYTPDIKVFDNMEAVGIYESAVAVKDYLVDEIMSGRLGKVIVIYSWPKTFDIQKPRVVKLLPCDELISKQAQFVDVVEKVIEESEPKEVIGFLANLWVTTRLYEIFVDTIISSASAQAQFLDDSVDKMKKDRERIKVKYRKAKKGDIDKSLRETFTARMLATAKK